MFFVDGSTLAAMNIYNPFDWPQNPIKWPQQSFNGHNSHLSFNQEKAL